MEESWRKRARISCTSTRNYAMHVLPLMFDYEYYVHMTTSMLVRYHDVPCTISINLYVCLVRKLRHVTYESIMCIISLNHDFLYTILFISYDSRLLFSMLEHNNIICVSFFFIGFRWREHALANSQAYEVR